jgi:antirestriction protein
MDATSLKTATLYAIHRHIAVKCKECNAAWLKCKAEHADPKDCLSAGRDIMKCVTDLYVNVTYFVVSVWRS